MKGVDTIGSKNLPQTYEDAVESCEKQRASKIYKTESLELTDARIGEQIGRSIEELESIVGGKNIPITDTARLQAQTILYLKACQKTSTMPSMSGLSRSCGRTRQGFYNFMQKNPSHPSTVWLQEFSDTCLDLLQNASLRNDVNTICGIFIMKSMFGLREGIELYSPTSTLTNDEQLTPEEIARKYGYLPEMEGLDNE